MKVLYIFIWHLISVFLYGKQDPPLIKFYFSGQAQGTHYYITYYADKKVVAENEIDSLFGSIDNSLSIYQTNSLINRFNNSKYGLAMDNHLHDVIRKSFEIYETTGGLSDITIYPLMKIWKFGPEPNALLPDSGQVRTTLRCVGSEKLQVVGNKLVKKTPCVKIDLNGIAQGYSLDVIAEFMEERGVGRYLIELGGEIRVKGRKPPGNERMKIGIEAPQPESHAPSFIRIVQLDSGAITTSGNYRKYHSEGGKIINHLINPLNGYPFNNELISVTVWAPDGITADGYDNAFMGMGLERSLLFLKGQKAMEAYFIYKRPDGSVADTATQGFYKLIRNDPR